VAARQREESAVTGMKKLHVAQDDFGFWELSFEDEDGSLTLLAHQFVDPSHLIQDAYEMVLHGELPHAVAVVDPPLGARRIPARRVGCSYTGTARTFRRRLRRNPYAK
jgi:hypothetical protein